MPKQSLHINRFEGGMNTDFAPEDLPDNSLLNALGISVSRIGRVVMPGDPHDNQQSHGIANVDTNDNPGYGLFSYNSDYASDASEAPTQYLALANGSAIQLYNGTAWNDDSIGFDMGANAAGTASEPSYYAPNGDLRVCDGKFSSTTNVPKWFGFTPNKTLGLLTSDAGIGGWNVQDASIEGGYPKDSSGISTNAQLGLGAGNAEAQYIDGTNEWGLHIAYVEAHDSGTATSFADSTWQPNTEVDYKFYASFVYDDLQEGNPTQIKCHPTLKANASTGRTAAVVHNDSIKFIDRATTGYIHYAGIDDCTADTMTVHSYSNNNNVALTDNNYAAGDVVYIAGTNSYNGYHTIGVDTDANTFTVAVDSDLGGAEAGYVSKVGTNQAIYFAPVVKFNGDASTNFCFGAVTAASATNGNQRITGTRLYWSSSEDGHGDLWLMMDINFEKGVKCFGIGKDEPTVTDYIPMVDRGSSKGMEIDWKANGIDFNVWKHPPKYETYESLNGYSHTSKLDAKWKTAVIANGRAYVANVKRKQKSTFNIKDTELTSGKKAWDTTVANDPTFGDRILKSPVDRFDTFPEEMAIELFGGDDGDSVIKLETFADRLFVFKKNTLHILNIAKDVEILESSQRGMGLDGGLACQSCLTSTGIAWMNSNGVYHYNGESVQSLTDNKIELFWKGGASAYSEVSHTVFWMSNASDVPSIGFDYKSNKIIIHKTSTASGSDKETVLIFDMKIKAWTWLNQALENEERTNMAHYDGKLIYHEDDTDGVSSFYAYTDAPKSPGLNDLTVGDAMKILTKPFNFGSPLQRKKIYKVYITYRTDDEASNVHVQYYVNGEESYKNFTTDATNPFGTADNIALASGVVELDNTANVWTTAVLKPATSSEANNIKSFGLKFFNEATNNINRGFEINDITIVYRSKSVK